MFSVANHVGTQAFSGVLLRHLEASPWTVRSGRPRRILHPCRPSLDRVPAPPAADGLSPVRTSGHRPHPHIFLWHVEHVVSFPKLLVTWRGHPGELPARAAALATVRLGAWASARALLGQAPRGWAQQAQPCRPCGPRAVRPSAPLGHFEASAHNGWRILLFAN